VDAVDQVGGVNLVRARALVVGAVVVVVGDDNIGELVSVDVLRMEAACVDVVSGILEA